MSDAPRGRWAGLRQDIAVTCNAHAAAAASGPIGHFHLDANQICYLLSSQAVPLQPTKYGMCCIGVKDMCFIWWTPVCISVRPKDA